MLLAVKPKSRIPQPISLTPAASGYLDAIRSLAAMAVMFGHCRTLFFADYQKIDAPLNTAAIKILYFMTGFGHQSVMAFFVLSGFFIVSSILRKLDNGWNSTDYAIERGVRLYIVLLPALLIGGLLDHIGIRFFNHGGLYSGPLFEFGSHVPAHDLKISDFLGNLFFLQTRFASVFGSNGPLWSLFNEFWYYVLFPLMVAIVMSAKRRQMSALLYGVGALFALWIVQYQLTGFVVWLSGGVIALIARHYPFPRSRRNWIVLSYVASCFGVVARCLVAARTGNGPLGNDLAVGLSFALLVHGLVQCDGLMNVAQIRLAKTFAGFSYSLYLLHFPLLFLIRAILLPVPQIRWQPDGSHLAIAMTIASGVLMYAYAISYFTEQRTSGARAWVRCRLPGRSVSG